MKAICEDELVIDCAGYKAIDSGAVLFGDAERDEVIAFVPDEKLRYLLPEDVVEREHERLGLPAPEISSPEDLEARLTEFAEEVDALREQLDRQVEALIDEGAATDEADLERDDRLRERRRAVDRSLQKVRQRAQQFRQLSTADTTETGTVRTGEAVTEVDSLRAEMDERFEAIEARLEELGAGGEPAATEQSETGVEEADPFDPVDGLGPTFSSRLVDAGITTLQELAESSPEAVANATSTSQSRASGWIEQAESLLEGQQQAA